MSLKSIAYDVRWDLWGALYRADQEKLSYTEIDFLGGELYLVVGRTNYTIATALRKGLISK